MSTHDFIERNRWSLAARQTAFCTAAYHKAFSSLVRCEPITDLTLQRLGVDRLLVLSNGIELTVDEKIRERHDTGDILLEYRHEGQYSAPGWIEKDLTIDYLAYGFLPSRRCYLFDWRMLRRAWVQHKDSWLGQYRHIQAPNNTYTTRCVAVPIPILQQAVRTASVIDVGSF